MGVAGAQLARRTVLVTGLAGLLAGDASHDAATAAETGDVGGYQGG
jgi:hypothetical protein